MKGFKIRLPKAEDKIKDTYNDYEIDNLLTKPNIKKCTFSDYRNWAIICFFLGVGCRVNTLVNVKNEDLDFYNDLIALRKLKNKKQQIVPMSPELKRVLQEYTTIRKGEPDDYLFCTIHGEQLTTSGVQTSIKRYNKKRGLTKTSVHSFRHTFGKNWVMAGGDISKLQTALGHSSIETTKKYANIFGIELKDDYEQYSTLDRKMNEKSKGDIIKMKK